MITIKAEGFEDLMAGLEGMERQMPYATANGINATARRVKEAEIAVMKQVFPTATPFTMNSLKLTPAHVKGTQRRSIGGQISKWSSESLTATVWFKDPPNLSQKDHYLLPQVEGGSRPLKPYEMGLGGRFTAPGKGRILDNYGNLGRGQVTKIMSQSGSFRESGSRMNRTRRGGKVGDMIMISTKRGKMLPGIYERTEGSEIGGRIGRYMLARAMGAKKGALNKATKALIPRGLKPVLNFLSKAPTYSKRFDFYGVAQKVVDANLRDDMVMAIEAERQRELAYRGRKGK